MFKQPNVPGHFVLDRQRAMLLPPEQQAAPSELVDFTVKKDANTVILLSTICRLEASHDFAH